MLSERGPAPTPTAVAAVVPVVQDCPMTDEIPTLEKVLAEADAVIRAG